MIEVTLLSANGRTILYPARPMSRRQDTGGVNDQTALSFFGPGEEDAFKRDDMGWDHISPHAVIGECRVVDYSHVEEYISLGDVEFIDVKYKERILVKTPNDHFVYLHSEAADYLTSKEITLFGMDVVMEGERDRLEFLSHRRFKDQGITVIEGLDLSSTPGGCYFLVGLPARQPARLAADAAASKRVRSAGASKRSAGGPAEPVYGGDASARVYLIPL